MSQNIIIILILIATALFLTWLLFYIRNNKQLQKKLNQATVENEKQQEAMSRKMYQLAILKELGERIGYSLNIEKIIDIITGSLSQFIEYSAVSYMLLEPERIIFKIHLEQSVSREFIDEVKERMLKALAALVNKELEASNINETLSGAILIEEISTPVLSYFNIPLVISDKVVGILTVAHTKAGLYQEEEMTILYKIVKQAAQAVSQLHQVVETEQSKLNAMVESMTEGVVMTDKAYRLLVVNPAARKVIGYSQKKEISIFDFIDNLSGKFDIRGKLEESVKLDKLLISEEVLIGDQFYKIIVAPVKSDLPLIKGEILGGVLVFQNITQEKEIEKMREDFTSMMVHELRSPLDGIKKISKLLQEEYIRKDKKSYQEFIQLIYKDSSKMLEMVNDLLDVAKLEVGKFVLNKAPVDIRQLIEERIKFYQPLAQEAELAFNSFFDQNFPTEVSIDSTRITQVLNNLLGNSLKFTEAGGTINIQGFIHRLGQNINEEAKKLNIKWFSVAEKYNLINIEDSLVMAVTDSGIGITEKNQQMLFNKFMQFPASTRSGEKKGTGLGLVIAKGIIEAHHGKIGIGSQAEKGSTFYFSLPLTDLIKINNK